jgi:hypothetical protein
MDDQTCEECEALDGTEIGDDESWDDVVGGYPGEMHSHCRCFEWYDPEGRPTAGELEELPTPQGLEDAAYNYILPIGALLFLWGNEEEKESPQYQEDDYEDMLEWGEIW